MKIIFDKLYLRELYEKGKTSDKKHRFQPDIIKRYRKVIHIMENAPKLTDLMTMNSLKYKKLQGDKKVISSVRVTDKYRIEFEEKCINGQNITSICNIKELSNHYE